MRKFLPHFLVSLSLAVVFFGSVNFVQAQGDPVTTAAVARIQVEGGAAVTKAAFDFIGTILSPLGGIIMKLASWITILAGVILNASVYYTVIQMAQSFSDVKAINVTWTVVRDLINMAFIFILLYASIMLIVGQGKDTRGLIVKMVIAAILVNFSLFFTKFIIDIANLLALTFYNAIAPQAALGPDNFLNAGLSNSMIKALKVQTLWKGGVISSGSNLFITLILSSVVLLITAFVFFAVSIMFIIRYVILIFVMILSPLMFAAMILPQLSGFTKRWWSALIGQAFFAPVYFFLTWVTILLVTSISDTTLKTTGDLAKALSSTDYSPGAIPILINFAVIIVFLIASLIISKKVSDSAGKGANGLTKWAMGAAGGATLGVTGRLGRGTFGRLGQMAADSEKLKKAAPTSRLARLALATGQKTAGSSFDVRSSKLSEGLGSATGVSFGKGSGKGGFNQIVKDKTKTDKETADSLKPSDLVINQAERALDDRKKNGTRAEIAAAQARVDELKGVSEEESRKRKVREIIEANNYLISEKDAQKQVSSMENARLRTIQKLKTGGLTQQQAEDQFNNEVEGEVRNQMLSGKSEADARKVAAENIGIKLETMKGAGTERKESYAGEKEKGNRFLGFSTNRVAFVGKVSKETKIAAMEIRKSIKEKKPAEKIAEEIAKSAKVAADDAATTPTPTSSPAPSGESSNATTAPPKNTGPFE